jgi:hypothetical protein
MDSDRKGVDSAWFNATTTTPKPAPTRRVTSAWDKGGTAAGPSTPRDKLPPSTRAAVLVTRDRRIVPKTRATPHSEHTHMPLPALGAATSPLGVASATIAAVRDLYKV